MPHWNLLRIASFVAYIFLWVIHPIQQSAPFSLQMHAYKRTHTRRTKKRKNTNHEKKWKNTNKQTNKQLSRFSVCTESSSMFFVTAPCMYRITHGASSILKLNANMWLNIKAIDFMRGLKRKFVRSVDSFKLNANAECQCWYFGCCCCFGLHNSQDCQIQIQHCLFGFIETKIFGRHTCRRILLMSLSLCISSARSFQTGIHSK